ncbi:MAG TPA: twin-arginine translocation pathway signal [Bacteroidetes bacterium]|nr:twin-arginine translocation pathway signal [Bacteroidota bacterium]
MKKTLSVQKCWMVGAEEGCNLLAKMRYRVQTMKKVMNRRNFMCKATKGVAGVIGLGGITAWLADLAFSAPGYRGPKSDHFDGTHFHNLGDIPQKGFWDVLKWRINRKNVGYWPPYADQAFGEKPVSRVEEGLRITFINHATLLIQWEGLNILTDPVYARRVSPISWLGPERVRPPGIRFEDLPPIDVVLLTHNHYDHCDPQTLGRLQHQFGCKIITTLGNEAFLVGQGIRNVTEMDWWDTQSLSEVMYLTCVPAQHFSGRGLSDRNKTLWAGFVLTVQGKRLYFAGDTGYGPFVRRIQKQFPEGFDVGILPIGAYRPEWFMSPVHVSPAQAVQMHQELGIKKSIPMHYGTFEMADEGLEEPLSELRTAIEAQNLDSESFRILKEGASVLLVP